jgi:hypothetical protein
VVYAFGFRPVLNELECFAAKHHGARGDGQVFSDLKFAFVDLPGHAEVVAEVVDEVLQTVQQALSARFGDALKCAGIAEQGVGRRERLGEQLQDETCPLAILGGGVGAIEHAIEHVAPRDEPLHEALVVTAFLPDHMTEAAVTRVGRDLRSPHGDREQLAREGKVLFDEYLRIERHEPQEPPSRD